MTSRHPVLILIITVLASACIAGCTSTGGGYSSAPNSATSGVSPGGTLTSGPPGSASDSSVGAQTATIDLTAAKMAFDRSTITVPAGALVVVNFHNRETAGSSQVTGIAHNFAVYDSPAAKTTIFRGEIITGGGDATYRFNAPTVPGTYFFRCDVHPAIMNGTFIVV